MIARVERADDRTFVPKPADMAKRMFSKSVLNSALPCAMSSARSRSRSGSAANRMLYWSSGSGSIILLLLLCCWCSRRGREVNARLRVRARSGANDRKAASGDRIALTDEQLRIPITRRLGSFMRTIDAILTSLSHILISSHRKSIQTPSCFKISAHFAVQTPIVLQVVCKSYQLAIKQIDALALVCIAWTCQSSTRCISAHDRERSSLLGRDQVPDLSTASSRLLRSYSRDWSDQVSCYTQQQ